MAITRVQTQVTWSSASTLSVTSSTEVVSDVFTLDDTCVNMSIQLSADNASGSPASGDTAVWRIRWSNGDVLADSGDDYDTAEHAQLIATLDTVAANTPGEDPVRLTVSVPPTAKKFKLCCICANAATRNITIAARIDEQRAA